MSHAPYFTPEGYRQIVRRALDLSYRVTPFRDFAPPTDAPLLLLRHDLDHSLAAAVEVARLEAEAGVAATYFVQVACPFYNVLAPDGRAAIRALTDLGHEVGLHYEASRYEGDGGDARLALDVALVEDLADAPVVSAAQHLPSGSGRRGLGGALAHDAYDARFTEPPMAYVSDSLMRWRQATPHEMLDRRASFQFLTHPLKWTAHPADLGAMLDRALADEQARLARAYDEIREHYARLLRDRERLDAAFRAARGEAP